MAAQSYAFRPKADLFEPIAAKLKAATGFPSYFAEKTASKANTRCWEWEPSNGPFGVTVGTYGHAPEKFVDGVRFAVVVACIAKDFDDCWLMLQQLRTAVSELQHAVGRFRDWTWVAGSGEPSTLKYALEVVVEWDLPVLEQPLTDAGRESKTITGVALGTDAPAAGAIKVPPNTTA